MVNHVVAQTFFTRQAILGRIKFANTTMAPTGHAAAASSRSKQDDDDAGIDDLLWLIPSSCSVEHLQNDYLFSARDDESSVCGGTSKSSDLQLYSNDERPAKQKRYLQMQTMLSRASSASMPTNVEKTPTSVQDLVDLGLTLTSSSSPGAGNLKPLQKSSYDNGVGTFGWLLTSPSSASSSSSSSPASSSPEAPPLIQLPQVHVGNTSISPFGGGLLDLGMTSASFAKFSISTSGNAIALTNASTTVTSANKGITADELYAQILDSMLDQAKSVEEAYKRNEAYERGISWRELLHTTMDLHPLAANKNAFARDAGKVITAIVPRRHYLPILLEAARVWRRAVEETIDRRLGRDEDDRMYSDWEDRSDYDGSDGGKYKLAQHIIPPVDRRLLARQAGWIVQRYLTLHGVFTSPPGNDANNDKIHAWDDFSGSNSVVSLHFLHFVYDEFLRPAFEMGWTGLIGEKIEAQSSSASQMMRYSSNLLGPVIGALQTILVETKGHHSAYVGYGPAHTNRMLGWTNNERSVISKLGDAGTILTAKLASLVRITSKFIFQDDIEEKEADLHDEGGRSQLYMDGKGYSRDEAKIILDDCIDEWTSLAKHRRSALVKASRARVADVLATAANQIVLCHKRLYKFGKDGVSPCEAHRMVNLIHGKFLSPNLGFQLPNLATNTDVIGEKSLACNLIEGIRYMYPKESAGPHQAIKIERSITYNLRRIGLCPFACDLIVKLKGLEDCRLKDLEQGKATQLHQSCLALWKGAARAYSTGGLCSDEAELIVLAGRLIVQHQRIQKTYSFGVNFSLSSVDETCSILDFAHDNFLRYGAEYGIDFARMHKTAAKHVMFSESPSKDVETNKEVYSSLQEGPYEIIIGALQHLIEMGNDGVATKYYHQFCSAGTEDGEHKIYLDAELPFTNGLWPHPSSPTPTVGDKWPEKVRSLIRS